MKHKKPRNLVLSRDLHNQQECNKVDYSDLNQVLMKTFIYMPYLTVKMLEKLVQDTKLSKEEIEDWFENKRIKLKVPKPAPWITQSVQKQCAIMNTTLGKRSLRKKRGRPFGSKNIPKDEGHKNFSYNRRKRSINKNASNNTIKKETERDKENATFAKSSRRLYKGLNVKGSEPGSPGFSGSFRCSADSVMEVSCNGLIAEFHTNLFIPWGGGHSIFYKDKFLSPGEFEKIAGSRAKNWKKSLQLDGKPIEQFFNNE